MITPIKLTVTFWHLFLPQLISFTEGKEGLSLHYIGITKNTDSSGDYINLVPGQHTKPVFFFL